MCLCDCSAQNKYSQQILSHVYIAAYKLPKRMHTAPTWTSSLHSQRVRMPVRSAESCMVFSSTVMQTGEIGVDEQRYLVQRHIFAVPAQMVTRACACGEGNKKIVPKKYMS